MVGLEAKGIHKKITLLFTIYIAQNRNVFSDEYFAIKFFHFHFLLKTGMYPISLHIHVAFNRSGFRPAAGFFRFMHLICIKSFFPWDHILRADLFSNH